MAQKIGLASDHAGYELKEYVKSYLEEKGMAYKDYGTYSTESCDYPDYAHALASGIEGGEVETGVAVCGSGEGISRPRRTRRHRAYSRRQKVYICASLVPFRGQTAKVC